MGLNLMLLVMAGPKDDSRLMKADEGLRGLMPHVTHSDLASTVLYLHTRPKLLQRLKKMLR